MPTTSVICAIALKEERYIDEWIHYHLSLGFHHIYVYDNSDDHSLQNKQSDRVTIIHFPGKSTPGKPKQIDAYHFFINEFGTKHKWAAFIDLDEFIVLKKHNSISTFLSQYERCSAVGLNWLMFGTNHCTDYHSEPVTKRFTRCAAELNQHIKSIVQLRYAWYFNSDPHYMTLRSGTTCDTSYQPITGPFHPTGKADVACIHHYYTKSEQEFREKIERGRPDMVEKRSLDELDNIHTQNNDVINTDAWEFYSRHL
jgi:Glycosyl transferase family 2